MKNPSNDKTCSEQDSNFSHKKETSLRNRHRRPDKQLYVPRAIRSIQKQSSAPEDAVKVPKKEEKYCVDDNDSLPIDHAPNVKIIKNDDVHHASENSKTNKIKSELSSSSFTSDVSDIECSYSESLKINKIRNAQSQIDKTKLSNNCLKSEKIVSACESYLEERTLSCNNETRVKNNSYDENTEYLFVSEDSNIPVVDDVKYDEPADVQMLSLNPSSSLPTHDIESKECFNIKECDTSISTNDDSMMLDDSWESMFNDEGDCLDPEIVNELCKVTGRLKVHVAKNDYSDYQPNLKTVSDNYDHIVELSFPSEFITQDLVSFLTIFHQEAYTIKWVDDCHALAVFTSPTLANQAFQLTNQIVKVHPISDGTKESKAKAKWLNNYDEPSKPRPTTSTVLARRLVSGALGLKDKTPKEQREKERDMLREAKEKKRLKAKQRQDIWDGVIL